MAKSYAHLTPKERYYIRKRLKAGDSRSEIARSIGRSPSTVSRELRRNAGQRGCRPKQAQRLGDYRHADSRRGVRLTEAVRSQVIGKLRLDWSPEQISGRMRLDGGDWVSCETIHRLVWRDKRAGGDLHTCLRHSSRKRGKRYGKHDFRGRIPGRTDISERPQAVEARASIGHWEGDTVIGKGHRGGLVTLAERKSKALLAGRIARKTKAETADALRRITKGLEGIFDTITYDNGREFSDHALVSEATGSDAYFARPHHSWERGLNEHSNGLPRSTSRSPCRSTRSPTSRSGTRSPGSTTGRASASASERPSRSCKTPTILAKLLSHRALHLKVECGRELCSKIRRTRTPVRSHTSLVARHSLDLMRVLDHDMRLRKHRANA